jgi:hypothetical protein
MEIPNIGTRNIQIRELNIPPVINALENTSQSIPYAPPVVVNIGVPIVDVPGCVEAHESNNKSKTVGQDDSKGMITYCDAGIPSYNPINFEPEQMILTEPAKTPKVDPPKPPEVPKSPEVKPPVSTAKIDCPTPAQEAKEPVGTYVEGFRKKVTEYKLIGNECVQITETVPLPQQIVAGLPSAGVVMTTGGVAVIATTSALMAKPLADLLLKVVKPTVKKVVKKIAKIRGKQPIILSTSERRNEQRDRNHAIMAIRQTLKRK